MRRLRASAPAKVNLGLAVTGVREDGYHLLRSVFLSLSLRDELEVEVDAAAARDTLSVAGHPVATDDNLVLRAVTLLRGAVDGSLPALRFRLLKRIPVAAGLGGGSSDAAAALELALAAWDVRLGRGERMELAARLGADVPFFAAGHAAALVEGIGERVTRLPPPVPAAGSVLITPPAGLSTAAVFREHDRGPAGQGAATRVSAAVDVLRQGTSGTALAAVAEGLGLANDLWPAASRLAPHLAAIRAAAAGELGRSVLLSGSGPTLFTVYPSAGAAAQAARALQAASLPELEGVAIVATSTSASEETREAAYPDPERT